MATRNGYEDMAEGGSSSTLEGHEYGGEVTVHFAPLVDGTLGVDADLRIVATADRQFIGAEVTAGDHDGDGSVDLIIAGGDAVHIFEGPLIAGVLTLDDAAVRLVNAAGDDASLGAVIEGAGDLDGDGAMDLLIGHSDGRADRSVVHLLQWPF